MMQRTIADILGWLDHYAGSPNQVSGQYLGNELPLPRKSARSEYSCYTVNVLKYLVMLIQLTNDGTLLTDDFMQLL